MIAETLAELVRKHVTVLGEIGARKEANAAIYSATTRHLYLVKSDEVQEGEHQSTN